MRMTKTNTKKTKAQLEYHSRICGCLDSSCTLLIFSSAWAELACVTGGSVWSAQQHMIDTTTTSPTLYNLMWSYSIFETLWNLQLCDFPNRVFPIYGMHQEFPQIPSFTHDLKSHHLTGAPVLLSCNFKKRQFWREFHPTNFHSTVKKKS